MKRQTDAAPMTIQECLDRFRSRQTMAVKRDGIIFKQGEPADALYYLIFGRVRYSVSNPTGVDGMLFVFSEGDVFGERCLNERSKRFGTACALVDSVVMRLESQEVRDRLTEDPAFGKFLLGKMLDRTHEYEEVLLLHLQNNSELRLASVLLRLAGYFSNRNKPLNVIRGISQSQLADLVGTTRPRINVFMNHFRRLGLIAYNEDEIEVKIGLVKRLEKSNRKPLAKPNVNR
jgi:CRP-like cAMP-binding protein